MNDQIFQMNLINNKTKIKEEVINVEIEIKKENVSEVDLSLSALNYGEIFILHDGGNPYLWWIRCNTCNEKFTGLEKFLNHATNTHLKQEPAIVKTKNENFSNFEMEIKNENVSELDGSLSALSYGEIFILQVDEENPFLCSIRCNICQEKFTVLEKFLNHAKNTHLKKEQAIVFKAENEDFYNENSVNSDNNDIYNINTATQSDEINEDLNYKVESGVFANKIKNVEMNNITFEKSPKLRRQKSKHLKNDNKMYECNICHEKFSKEHKRLYRNHRYYAHKDILPCSICEKKFKSKSNLENHLLLHRGIKDFECPQCSSAFCSKASLSDHIRKLHSKKVPCTICKKLLNTKSDLKSHLRVHTGERPYVCEQCGRGFQTSSLLQSHIKRHNNDKRFECDVCGKKFLNNTYLRDHKVIHTDAKPYGCDICSSRFNSTPALRKHKHLHSGVKKYQCKICGKAYAQSPGLYTHMKSHKIADEKLSKVFSLV